MVVVVVVIMMMCKNRIIHVVMCRGCVGFIDGFWIG
jgi:hypothetical protein